MDDITDDKIENGIVLTFPGGESVSASEIGAEYAVGQGGQVSIPDIIDANEEEKKREEFIRKQPLIQALSNKSDLQEIIRIAIKEVAEELAHLKWERKKATKEGKNTANYNTARVAGLQQLINTLIRKQESARAEQLDLKSPRFQNIVKIWLEFLCDAMQKSGLGDQEIDIVINTIKADIKDFELRILDI